MHADLSAKLLGRAAASTAQSSTCYDVVCVLCMHGGSNQHIATGKQELSVPCLTFNMGELQLLQLLRYMTVVEARHFVSKCPAQQTQRRHCLESMYRWDWLVTNVHVLLSAVCCCCAGG
jgi:hypothetical protein